MLPILKRPLLILFLLFNFSSPVFAIDFPSVFYLGIQNGLSNNEVNCIFKDHKGYMWFGTQDGLNRYDGYNFKIFRKKIEDENSLINNRVLSIEEDDDHQLWIATMGGTSVFNPVSEKFHSVYFQAYRQRVEKKVENTLVVKKVNHNDMLIGTAKDGLLYFDSQTKATNQIPLVLAGKHLINYQVNAIKTDKKNQVWLLIDGIGLCRYDRDTKKLVLINKDFKSANCLEEDQQGNLWIGTNGGIYSYNTRLNKSSFTPLQQVITSLYFDQKFNLWITTDGGGMFFKNSLTGKIEHPLKPGGKHVFGSASLKSIMQDQKGRYWVGALRGGIAIIDPHRHQFNTLVPGPVVDGASQHYFISSFGEDQYKNLWIGTDGHGLYYWDRKKNNYTNYKGLAHGLKSNHITKVLSDYKHDLWITTWGAGIYKLNKTNGIFKHFKAFNPDKKQEFTNTWELYEDKQHQLWASAYNNGGLYKLNRISDQFELFDGTIGNVLTMNEDSEGNLWAGTDDRIIKIDQKTKKHKSFPIGYRVRSILEHTKNNLWIGTEGGGLLLFNTSNGQFKRFSEREGLPHNAVLNILKDQQGHLWLSTFIGLSKFDPVHLKFHNFSVSDGLQSNQFNYAAAYQMQSGEMIFGGIKGYNLFDPGKIIIPKTKLHVLLQDIKINDISIGDDLNTPYVVRHLGEVRQLLLPYDKTSLSFEYAAIEYSKPDKVNYAYYLEGWDKKWIQAGRNRTINYSRLEEGKYTLHLKAMNDDTGWGEEKLIQVTVHPPWGRTWWAYLLYASVFSSLVGLFIRYNKKQTALAYEVRLAQMETEKEKELNEKKISFFTNITHELRTPLTLIVNPMRELINRSDNIFKNELNIVYRNASRLLTLVDQLLLFKTTDAETSKFSFKRLNLHDLCKNTYECFAQMADSKDIAYTFASENTDLTLLGDFEKLEIAFFNILSNAFKFTPQKGRIMFTILEHENHVEIMIRDTGCGIDDRMKDKLFEKYFHEKAKSKETGFGIGLYLTKRFIDGHQGELGYSSSIVDGTCFTIKLKKGQWCNVELEASETEKPVAYRPQQIPFREDITLPKVAAFEITEKKSILIVDDHDELRQYIKQIFSDEFIIYEAGDGASGFELTKTHLPDIVISDVIMKEISGIDLCKQIKSDPLLSYIPVILLSSLCSAESKLEGLESGADHYIFKPFDKSQLSATIHTILKSRNILQQYFQDSITFKENHHKISETYKILLEKCIAIVEENLTNEAFNAKTLAKDCNMSYSNFYKKVKSISGQSVNSFIRSIRLRRAAVLLLSTDSTISDAAFEVGIYDIKYFRVQFKKLYGMNPSDYIKKYRQSFSQEYNLIK
ncbi:hybrid sensor histidine kinase/response regulator transcription factor [Pedobacter immunditicola]|uniref:hybrid sensor histidine kinase/response regulator transcription factor n=1 Tax=Pedobacter immunditicola TaxID=3133440 RepID=UPI0030B3669E